MPQISVIMPVYNGERFLSEAVESILKQTYQDFEFIIVDDGSTDRSLEIIQYYQALDERIILIENGKNIGVASSLNKGISAAKGEFIARMDADDISLPERLEQQRAFMFTRPDLGVLGCNYYRIHADGELMDLCVLPESHDQLQKRINDKKSLLSWLRDDSKVLS